MIREQTSIDELNAYRAGYLEQALASVRDKLASGRDRRKIIDDIDQMLAMVAKAKK